MESSGGGALTHIRLNAPQVNSPVGDCGRRLPDVNPHAAQLNDTASLNSPPICAAATDPCTPRGPFGTFAPEDIGRPCRRAATFVTGQCAVIPTPDQRGNEDRPVTTHRQSTRGRKRSRSRPVKEAAVFLSDPSKGPVRSK